METKFERISPSDFFYRNRDLAGFSSPSRALYMSVRELVENSLDACEEARILPTILVDLSLASEGAGGVGLYRLRVQDNGIGVDAGFIPLAFATVLYGSKYGLRQSRGTFGLGGKMALLYGQITTNHPFKVVSSTGRRDIHEFSLMIDIVENKPNVFDHKRHRNSDGWRGTAIEFELEADYSGSKAKIVEYLKETAMSNPHATLSFVDPRGRLYMYERVVTKPPKPPVETLPHPYGVDVETMGRMLGDTGSSTMRSFLTSSFQKMGPKTAKDILRNAEIANSQNPKELVHDQVTQLVRAMKRHKGFRSPDAGSLSPMGVDFVRAGLTREFNPEFVEVVQRRPSSYSGFPFVIEAGIAYGGNVPPDGFHLYRFANKIPLLYDERSDVSWKVISNINWTNYKVQRNAPIAIATHVCSTKIPYKTVGKEAIADRPELERELTIAIREVARRLKGHLRRIERREASKKRLSIFVKYLPKIARFSARLAHQKQSPNVRPLLQSLGLDRDLVDEQLKLEAAEARAAAEPATVVATVRRRKKKT